MIYLMKYVSLLLTVSKTKFVFWILVYLTGCRPRLSASEAVKERQCLCSTCEGRYELKGVLMHIPVVGLI